ncbi:hypothetical protein MASR1M60_09470 [Rhodocyclaceae bacterium]
MKPIAFIALTLVSLLSHAQPACKVNDKDISDSYKGECKNGLAHGKGIAKGRDTYDGFFVMGNQEGNGTYIWGDSYRNCGHDMCGKKYVGTWKDGHMDCGKIQYWSGDSYDGCFHPDNRPKGSTKYQIEAENRKYARIQKCQHLYQGRVFKRENFFGHLNYIVIGFSPNQGRATVKAEHDGSMSEISCADIPE